MPKHLQVAAHIRGMIESGEIGPGQQLPSRNRLSLDLDVGAGTVDRAMAELRREGLVVSGSGRGTFVRELPERQEILLGRSARVVTRMPTQVEREHFDLDDGVPVFEVVHNGRTSLYPGDLYELRTR
jgi:DNA-binding transcriptional regulator YhcF (GntR family)